MDDSPVQTALCVIGHPIAGNPAQFCISRILQSLEMDWQCLSFDVPPETLETAIAGIDVLHFAGALIAPPHQSAVAKIVRDQQQSATTASGPLPLPRPALPRPALSSPALQQAAVVPAVGAAMASDHNTATSPNHPNEPSNQNPAESSLWCDALARNTEGRWEPCNFIGDALLQRIRQHEQQIGVPMVTCVFLGDQATFQSLMTPFLQCLPPATFYLGIAALERWPHEHQSIDTSHLPTTTPSAEPNNTAGGDDLAPDLADNGNPDESPQASPSSDPLHSPLLLIQPAAIAISGKKSGPKAQPNQAIVEVLLEDLHPQSLVVHLAPPGVAWPVLRGQDDSTTARINPLDLEVGRIAAALHRWTGQHVDREALAEAIEEYLEI